MINLACGMCEHVGPVDTFPANTTSIHNANRCPKCGSTKNAYNRVHGRLINAVIRKELTGPVTHTMVLQKLLEQPDLFGVVADVRPEDAMGTPPTCDITIQSNCARVGCGHVHTAGCPQCSCKGFVSG